MPWSEQTVAVEINPGTADKLIIVNIWLKNVIWRSCGQVYFADSTFFRNFVLQNVIKQHKNNQKNTYLPIAKLYSLIKQNRIENAKFSTAYRRQVGSILR